MNAFLLLLAFVVLPTPPEDLPGNWLQRFQLAEKAQEEGSLDAAINYLQSCFELAPENVTVAYHLACVHARAGRADEALSWLERAVDWGWADTEMMQWDKDLSPLWGSPKFHALQKRTSVAVIALGPGIQVVEPLDTEGHTGETTTPELTSLQAGGTAWKTKTGIVIRSSISTRS